MLMPLSGSLKNMPLLELLHSLSVSYGTGCLTLEETPFKLHLFFEKGILRSVTSNYIPNLDIASILMTRGIITAEACEALKKRIEAADGQEDDILESFQEIPQATLHSALRLQARSKFINLFKWNDGTFTFESNVLPQGAQILTGADMMSIVLKAIEKHLSPEYTRIKLEEIKKRRFLRFLERPLRVDGLVITPEEGRFIDFLKDQTDIRTLFKETSLPPIRIYQILIFLFAMGKINFATQEEVILPTPTDLQKTKWTREDVIDKIQQKASLAAADLMDLDLAHLDFSNMDLSGVNLQNASLRHANLQNSNLSGANLYNADLSYANLLGVNLETVNLTSAKIYKAQWVKTQISEKQKNSLIEEEDTGEKETTKIQYVMPHIPASKSSLPAYRKYWVFYMIGFVDVLVMAGIIYLLML